MTTPNSSEYRAVRCLQGGIAIRLVTFTSDGKPCNHQPIPENSGTAYQDLEALNEHLEQIHRAMIKPILDHNDFITVQFTPTDVQQGLQRFRP